MKIEVDIFKKSYGYDVQSWVKIPEDFEVFTELTGVKTFMAIPEEQLRLEIIKIVVEHFRKIAKNYEKFLQNKIAKKVVIRVEGKEITYCYHNCPHFETEGKPSSVMECHHPKLVKKAKKAKNPYLLQIISHPQCSTGFPDMCPIWKGINIRGIRRTTDGSPK